uniref:Putative ovule protein n=1 Tax=Solanum chacoense TaxID=4108 RepID=A0A0V0HI47_SOLCH
MSNRFCLFSAKNHLGHKIIPFFIRLSCVRTTSLDRNLACVIIWTHSLVLLWVPNVVLVFAPIFC